MATLQRFNSNLIVYYYVKTSHLVRKPNFERKQKTLLILWSVIIYNLSGGACMQDNIDDLIPFNVFKVLCMLNFGSTLFNYQNWWYLFIL
jgi:hypothetical protein